MRVLRHCAGLMPASRISFAYFASSAFRCAWSSAGVPPITAEPAAIKRSLISGVSSTAAKSRLRRSTIGLGVFAGAAMPDHVLFS